MGLYLYKIRYGKVMEVSIIGVILLILAVFLAATSPVPRSNRILIWTEIS